MKKHVPMGTNGRVKIKPAGMCPNMATPPKPKPRKKPNPYQAPITVKRYYKGIAYGVDLLRDDLLNLIEDEELKKLIKNRAQVLKTSSSNKLINLEKQKTKQKLKEWEEKEWESL